MADDLRKGCRVRLSGLSISILNDSEGCIVGPFDSATGRHPVKLLKPTEAVTAYPNGVKVKPANLERVQTHKQPVTEISKPKAKSKRAAQSFAGAAKDFMDPSSWALGMSPSKQAEWLVDCYRLSTVPSLLVPDYAMHGVDNSSNATLVYHMDIMPDNIVPGIAFYDRHSRMRVDDDYAWGGCNLHGLYDPEHTGDTIVSDFLLFCKLAVRHGVVPHRNWDWNKFLNKAAELLGYAFEKSDAKEKYGNENVFSVITGGRSLRATAEVVYGTSCMAGSDQEEDAEVLQLREVIEDGLLEEMMETQPELFEDVGGVAAWARLQSRMVAVQ
ncbi:hypothetical protein VOLCADRAFT_103978 [Volvox carteri f. nagariensis]|uniref:Uncharacterized protein n=1 Tax=Volvox carteri f. nagariensis TaxID=3068 RepID=D8TQG2_VOLCA|nr:uncharacterized protein VOLCADRAFT_103978 [Volvox carteri f. nagariensis]EFJ50399.1 hypothetical protein VOLCADRAFT_103978 [Volvox carteri f. nagariensis]|eukprot:XP_002948524.1 hypothetical protein VOLCADRAFT_103978 [Volvox carteri f. nagariensis]